MFRMLRDVRDELVEVRNAQIARDSKVKGTVSAAKIKDEGNVCLMAKFDIVGAWATGRTFYVESDCLVEVLDV